MPAFWSGKNFVLYVPDTHQYVRIAMPGENHDQVYVGRGGVAQRSDTFLYLEEVLQSGVPVKEDGKQLYYIRIAASKECLVAGDAYDHWVYFQLPRNRDNAKWIFEPVLDVGGKPVIYHREADQRDYPVYRIHDKVHKKYLSVNGPDYVGPLRHESEGSPWIQLL